MNPRTAARSLLAGALTLLVSTASASAQQPSAPPALPPLPAQSVSRMAPFQSAISGGDLAAVLRAWIPDAQTNDTDRTSGSTAITWAIGGHNPRPVQRFLVNRMLQHGAHPNAPDAQGWTPTSQAVRAGDAELVRQLLARGVPANATWGRNEPMSVLFELCNQTGETDHPRELRQRSDVLLTLFAAGAPLDARWGGAGTRYPAQAAIDRCIAPEVSPIVMLYALGGATFQVRQFLGRNATLPQANPAALAAQAAQLPSPPRADHSRFIEAVARGDLRAATAALPARESVDVVDQVTGTTPLTWVAHVGLVSDATRASLATALLDRGANVNAQDVDGATALHAAVENGWVAGVRLLLARGARVDVADRAGMQPLHNLCVIRPARGGAFREAESPQIAQLLVAARADVNALGGSQPGYRRTPGDGCTNDNTVSRAAVRSVLGAAGALHLRPVGLALTGLAGPMPPAQDAAP